MEKSTRVKARVKAHALKEFMDSNEKVIVMGHKIIDVDLSERPSEYTGRQKR